MTRITNPKRLPSPAWGGAGGGGHARSQLLTVNRVEDHLHHTLDIPRHLRIPEPQHAKSLATQPRIPRQVPRPAVPTAIHLDHQPSPQIGEINDIRPDGRLSPKVQPQHPVQFSQLRPKLPLLWRHLLAQFAGIRAGDGVDTGHALRPMPKAPHPNPPHKGEGALIRPPPAPTPTEKAPPLPRVGRGWGWGAGEETAIRFPNLRPCWMKGFIFPS
ncbi:MAG: hypothetical protein DDT34_02416 [Firmicutes bacterium]|nr:hypothetical protein [Bacillota bacterium]